jgi:hypothetical protein
VRRAQPPLVTYGARDGDIAFMLTCVKTTTRVDGSPKRFLDGFDDGFIGSYRRNGIDASPTPVAHVEYLHTSGRVLRLDISDNQTALKCDLTTPTQCYSIVAIGPPGKQLEDSFQSCIATLRFTSTEAKSNTSMP